LHSDEGVPELDSPEDPPVSDATKTESTGAPNDDKQQTGGSWRSRLLDALKQFKDWLSDLFG
jgi:hypothetical protein